MFEKYLKRISSRATDASLEGVKQTLNDRINQYGDIIQIGLVLSVIIFGGKHLIKQSNPKYTQPQVTPRLPVGTQPIIINNYYPDAKEALYPHGNYRYQPRHTQKTQTQPVKNDRRR